jgi:hypothetical protein
MSRCAYCRRRVWFWQSIHRHFDPFERLMAIAHWRCFRARTGDRQARWKS